MSVLTQSADKSPRNRRLYTPNCCILDRFTERRYFVLPGVSERRMKLFSTLNLAVRLTVPQKIPSSSPIIYDNRLIYPTAFFIAAVGFGVSSFSLKQLLEQTRRR